MRRSRARGTNAAAAATATDMDLEPEDSDRVVTPPSPPAVEFARSASERKFEVSGHTFQVPRSYSFIKAVGAGAYGVVWCALSHALRARASLGALGALCRTCEGS